MLIAAERHDPVARRVFRAIRLASFMTFVRSNGFRKLMPALRVPVQQ